MSASSFVFDIVVTKLNVANMAINDGSKLKVLAKIYNKDICLSSSCINVNDFQAGTATEFRAPAKKVREALIRCGLPMALYNEAACVGRAQIYFPDRYIESIERGMSDLIHTQSVEIVNHNRVVGTLDIRCRLIIKCDDEPLDNNINMQDIMFLVSNSQHDPNSCEPCVEKWESSDFDKCLDLDLHRYQSVNTDEEKYSNIFINNNNIIDALRPLKKLVEDCKSIIESINLKSCCGESGFNSRDKNFRVIHEAHRSSDSTSDKLVDFCRPKPPDMIVINENNQQIKPIRFCPLCLNNMSWLPKFAACPKCGVKPIPVKSEPDDMKNLTADQILKDYLDKPQTDRLDRSVDPNELAIEEDVTQQGQSRCRCSCENKLCAHCRIRKLCSDIFKSSEACIEQKPSDHCVKSEDSRPHLAKVFSDLRDLYNVKDTKDLSLLDHQCKERKHNTNLDTVPKQDKIVSGDSKKLSSSNISHKDNRNQYATKGRRTTQKAYARQQALVPRRHGWDWPSTQEARKYGWKPGAILRPIKRLMDHFLYYLPAEKADNMRKEKWHAREEMKHLPPILQVCKKGRETYVTLRAIKGGKLEKSSIVFKIVKSDFAVTLNDIKKRLKAQGFRKCTCHKSLMMCVCRSNVEKKQLEVALQDECQRRGLESCVNDLVLTDTSDSEADFDINVSPPSRAPQTPAILKQRTVEHATQITNINRKIPPRYPIKQGKYWRAHDCAAGGRYTGTVFGAPGEMVFEDGFFGHMGGGPHGVNPWRNRFGARTVFKGRRSDNVFSQQNRIPFAGLKKRGNEATSKKPIPVRLTKKFMKKIPPSAPIPANKHINMLEYLKNHNVFTKVKSKSSSTAGPDAQAAAQRMRRSQLQAPLCPIEFAPRLGRGFDPCAAQCYQNYNQCYQQWCSPWTYYG
ncbi:uncharacterized protein LOC26527429 [Drosophila mojavensis]|uniref:DUF4776 domain-containing protein n=1 Tax=Drosophila mojavensis TaxID=7230 RepID=A0A0Q9WZA9_DROMO|nr:uncharacterized protein LOC26527429 [Drosophila mojavensis]KRG01295.1 uncharacterized protein Dmoj_GI25788 [Drosophila mojavensis]